MSKFPMKKIIFLMHNFNFRTENIKTYKGILYLGAGYQDRSIPWISLVNIPYLLWVFFATAIQGSIAWINK